MKVKTILKGDLIPVSQIVEGQYVSVKNKDGVNCLGRVLQNKPQHWPKVLGERAIGFIDLSPGRETIMQYITAGPDAQIKVLTGKRTLEQLEARFTIYQSGAHLKDLLRDGHHIDTIGSDPEIWIVNENGKVIPAFTFLGKDHLSHPGPAGNIYNDGFQAEFAMRSQSCLESHTRDLEAQLVAVHNLAQKKNAKSRVSLHLASAVTMDREEMETYNIADIQLGCHSSFNAYHEEPLYVPDPRDHIVRSIGKHMHIGAKWLRDLNDDEADAMVRMIDKLYMTVEVAVSGEYDRGSVERRKFYGRAGEYRRPDYGIEYRPPSAIMMCHPGINQFSWDYFRYAAWLAKEPSIQAMWQGDDGEVRHIINENDVTLAREVVNRNANLISAIFERAWHGSNVQAAWKLVNEGIPALGVDPEAVMSNWKLNEQRIEPGRGRAYCSFSTLAYTGMLVR